MRILLLTHAFNSLTQRLYAELTAANHEVSVEFDISDSVTCDAVALWRPDIVIAPFMKRAIPEQVWREYVCLIVHPGIPGDRGPSALDWAILNREQTWGVTVLQATADLDAGPVWAWKTFPMRHAPKSSLYRREVTEAAVAAIFEALTRYESGNFTPLPAGQCDPALRGTSHPLMRQTDRCIDWTKDDTETVLRKLNAADGMPGVEDSLYGIRVRLFNAGPETALRGAPGNPIARSDDAVCIATCDGAVWIGHLKQVVENHKGLKLPATLVLNRHIQHLPHVQSRDIHYVEDGAVGYLHFNFHNGAMSTAQCKRLLDAYRRAKQRPSRVIVLLGGEDFWSNGLHLNVIEAAGSPADESWRNINAMDELCREIITTENHLTIASIRGNAGAGGVFLALAADRIYARSGVILNPHYKNMGNLYGSEYWTYLLPKRVGQSGIRRIMQHRLPLSAKQAAETGLIDACLAGDITAFDAEVQQRARDLARDKSFIPLLELKRKTRIEHETQRPLDAYRDDELRHMKLNFYGFDPSYHVARYKFVYRIPHAWTPLHLAKHRSLQQRPAPLSLVPTPVTD